MEGPIVGNHTIVDTLGTPEEALSLMRKLGVAAFPNAARLSNLKINETLRFDTMDNTGISVLKTAGNK